jgi:hypothetical protein
VTESAAHHQAQPPSAVGDGTLNARHRLREASVAARSRTYASVTISLHTLLRSAARCVLLLGGVVTGFAQPPDTLWTRTFGGSRDDYVYAVAADCTGAVVVVGRSNSPETPGGFCARLSAQGELLWNRGYGQGTAADIITDVLADGDGSAVFSGSLAAPIDAPVLTKVDGTGDTLWSRRYGESPNERAQSLCKASAGGYAIALDGVNGPVAPQITVIRTDEGGSVLWMHDYCRGDVYYVSGICQTPDGGFAISARVHDPFDFYVLKISSGGDSLWSTVIDGGDYTAYSAGITPNRGGDVFLYGWVDGDSTVGEDALVARVSAAGELRWATRRGGIGEQGAWGCTVTEDGGLVLAGSTNSGNLDNPDFYLLRLDSVGDSLWSRSYGSELIEHAWGGLAVGTSGHITIAGNVHSVSDGWDVYVVETTSEADATPSVRLPPPSSLRLIAIYPNPVNGISHIQFETHTPAFLSVDLFNVLGEAVVNMAHTHYLPGVHTLSFDATRFASGVYICRIVDDRGVSSPALPVYVLK